MTGGQIASLGCGILLLLPGGCFVVVGIGGSDQTGLGIGLGILFVAVALLFVAFSRRGGSDSGSAPPPGGANE